MYFSEICTIFFLDSFFHFLYLFKMWEIFMPHSVLMITMKAMILITFQIIEITLVPVFLWIIKAIKVL